MLQFAEAQPILGYADPKNALPKLIIESEEAAFQSINGFGRRRGNNRIVSLGNTAFPRLEQTLSRALTTAVRISDPKLFLQIEGGGLEMHSDPVIVVTWQIQASKAWRVHDAALMPDDMLALRVAQDTPIAAQLLSEFYSTLPAENAFEFTSAPAIFL